MMNWVEAVSFIRYNFLAWNLVVVVVGSLGFFGGFRYVYFLRECCKKSSSGLKRMIALIFVVPVCVFFFMNLIVFLGGLNRNIADSISFGFVAGVIAKLSKKPEGQGNVRLIAQNVDGASVDVWLDSLEVSIGDARNLIAAALNIHPASRVAIESGKGSFVTDITKPLALMVDESFKRTDFFGFVTMLCFFIVREEEKRKVTIADDNVDGELRGKRGMSFLGILHRPAIRYGDALTFIAKIAHAVDNRSNFNVTSVDKFAAAAPMTMHHLYSSVVRLVSWDVLVEDANMAEGASDTGESLSVASGSQSKGNRRSGTFFRKRKREESSKHGKSVCNGDTVLLECNGK
jgi:hypothetical protein